MRILILNQDWFAAEMRSMGHEVVTLGLATHLEVQLGRPVLQLNSVLKLLPEGFSPDVILWLDNSAPLLITGLHESSIPIAFYSVDTHHHVDLHSYLAHMMDHVFIAQKDYLHNFTATGTPVSWLPLWASRFVEASEEKKYGATFVGTRNPKLNPDRCRFFDALAQKVDIHLDMGEYWKIFPHAEIVVNQTVKRDLNFRVFEAMMCGSLLLTEASGNGLSEIFKDGEHLVLYEKDNVDSCAEKIITLLSDIQNTRRIAAAGRSEILKKHLPQHRAEEVLHVLQNIKKRPPSANRYFAEMINFGAVSTMIEHTDNLAGTQAITSALTAAERALELSLPPGELESAHLIMNAIVYDRKLRSTAGQELVNRYSETYPHNRLFAFSRIRGCLNLGKFDEARRLAQIISHESPETVFSAAENAISTLMHHHQGSP